MGGFNYYIPQVVNQAVLGAPPAVVEPKPDPEPEPQPDYSVERLEILELMRNHPDQRREAVILHRILMDVAQMRAEYIDRTRHTKHVDLEGFGPNYHVTQAGYVLPSWYDHSLTGNNIESLVYGTPVVRPAWEAWMGSPGHRVHLLAEMNFFTNQIYVGVGFYGRAYVVLSCPPSEGN